MKIVCYLQDGLARNGALEGDTIAPLEGPLDALKKSPSAKSIAVANVKIIAPVAPNKIVAVGVNYRDHAKEMGRELPAEPLIFIKPSTCVIGPGDPIVYPPQSQLVHHEAELAIVISRKASKVSEKDARHYILGYTCLNDVTARDLQRRDVQFTRGKGFDTFAPMGPLIATDIDPGDLAIEGRVSGEVRQHGRTSDMIFGCDFVLSYISHIMTLLPGDVISTGTPAGVGALKPGDFVEVEIEKIGCLTNTVIAPG